MAETMDNVKEFIEKYCKILHLANMPAQVRARFDKYAQNKDFDGDMKRWPDLLVLADRVKNGELNALPDLTDEKWEDLYHSFQDIFEKMAQNTYDFRYKDATTKAFFEKWYGDDKLFKPKQPISGLEDRIDHFAAFLEKNKFSLANVITDNNVYGLNNGFKYDSFVSDLKSKKYLNDPEVRDQLIAVVRYTQQYSDGTDTWRPWGKNPDSTTLERYDFSRPVAGTNIPALPLNTDEWFKVHYDRSFKHRAKEIFNKLLTSSVVFEDFQKYDYHDKIAKHIKQSITETDYANTESKNFVPPLYEDKKNIFQKAGEKLDKFEENALNPWTNVLQGTRRFFTPYARNIFEAIASVKIKDKEGKTQHIKPTDGLKGILDNKDKINDKLVEKSPKAKSHFKWIIDKLELYSKKLPKAFDGALHNPDKMRAIVSQFIVDAIQEGKADECKSAMEMLSSMKYRVFDSRTMDAFSKSEWNMLSDKGYSWNKYEGIRTATKIIDGGAKLSLHFAGRLVAAARNKRMRDNTKFNGKTKDFDNAYKVWKSLNNDDTTTQKSIVGIKRERRINDAKVHNLEGRLNNYIWNLGYADLQDMERNIQTDLETRQKDAVDKQKDLHDKQKQIEKYQTKQNEIEQKQKEIKQKQKEIKQKQKDYPKLLAKLQKNRSHLPADALDKVIDNFNNIFAEDLNQMHNEILEEKKSLKALQKDTEFIDLQTDLMNAYGSLTPANLEQKHDDLDDDIKQVALNLKDYQDSCNEAMTISQEYKEGLQQAKSLKEQEKSLKDATKEVNDVGKDKYMELMAFWDMLESFGKSHQFTFWTKKMRDKFLDGYGKGESKAQEKSEEFLQKYLAKYGGRAA